MSAPSPGQLRPNSAIYIGASEGGVLSTPPTTFEPLTSPGGTSRRGPHLPSPPHTNSTSGSAGEREANSQSGTRTKRATIELPAVTVMQDGEINEDFDDHKRYQDHDSDDRILPRPSLADKNKELLDKLERFGTLGKGRAPGGTMSPASRTISLGRASSASAAAAMTATSSMRHVSLNYPPRKSQEKDVFDRDDAAGRSHSASNSLSVPHTNSEMEDRSTTPPATPGKRLLELASNNASPVRQRLVSEPTSPRRLQMLRDRATNRGSEGTVNLSSPLRESTALSSPLHRASPLSNTAGRSSTMNSPGSSSLRRMTTLGTVDEAGDKRSPATRKARTPIPFEFLATGESEIQPPEADRGRQPSPGLYVSEGAPSSPGLYVSEPPESSGTRESFSSSIRAARRPRPPGIRNSIDRSYDQWEREQMGDAGEEAGVTPRQSEIVPEQTSIRRTGSAVGSGVRSVVNEGLRAAGLTRSRKVSDSGAVVTSPTTLLPREREHDEVPRLSSDMIRSGAPRLSSERDRSRSRMSVDAPLDMDSLRERASRNAFFSPNVRGTRTIHNVLNPEVPADSPSPGEEHSGFVSGRETPANLRQFKRDYSGTGMVKSYTSPSGTQRHLPSRSVTALNMISYGSEHRGGSVSNSRSSVPGTPSPMKNSIPLGGSSTQSSPNTVNGAGPVNLLQDALWMFESHVQRLPPSSVPEIANDVLRDARGIVNAAVALNGALRGAAGVCVDEQIEAEISKEGKGADTAVMDSADVWRRVGAEFREDARVADELVRALTSFMIGAGRMLRVSSSNGHGRMTSINGGDGSISRAGGSSLARGSSISRAGGSSDGRRSVEGWSLGIGMSGTERRSIDGRRSVEPGSRRSADDYREETMRRLTSRQGGTGTTRDLGEAGSNGSGGSRGHHRVSFQGFAAGDSRPGTSLSSRRELSRISQEDSLSSPGPRTFTSLSSRRSTGAPTPAMSQKSLPRLPMPAGELSFPQSEDGGDRTPIELPRPHMRHSTMPTSSMPPPLPTLPSESLIQRSKTIGKHAASNSITSASTTSTTRPKLPGSSATVRGSTIFPATGGGVPTTAVTPTTARPREMSFSAGGDSPTTSPFSLGRARGSAAVNGLQQIVTKDSPRKRTISNADAEDLDEDPRTARLHPKVEPNSSSTLSSMARSSSGGSQVGFPSSSSRDSPSSGSPTSFEPRKSGVRPSVNRRTSSTMSGATITSSVANGTTPARPKAVTRMSSAGTLSNPNYGSRSSLLSGNTGSGGGGGGNSTESGTDQDRKLRRTNMRLSLSGVLDRRGGIGDLLGGGRRLGRPMLEGDERDVGDSPSLSARERRERRRVAEGV